MRSPQGCAAGIEGASHVTTGRIDPPPRPLGGARALLTAAEGYPALERAALAAKRAIWFWFRIFDPTTPTVSPEAKAAGCADWRALLAMKAAEGVEVAVAMSDFDPCGAPAMHASAWRAARSLAGIERLHCMVADHGARAGSFWRVLGWPVAMRRVEQLRRRINDGDGPRSVADLPGLAPYLEMRKGRAAWRAATPPPELKPATHHQKVAVFDGERAILGGLDIDRRRWDTPDHDRPPDETWRDVSVEVDGPVAVDLARHIALLWNAERARMEADAPPLDVPAASAQTAPEPPSIRLSVTRSTPVAPAPAGFGVALGERGLERDHLALISRAERLLYVETQFLRCPTIAEALAERARAAPRLTLILLLPAAPEPVAFDGASDPASRMGEHLQAQAVARVRDGFGPRAAIVSPVQPGRGDADGRAELGGSDIVYVHSKVMIADDRAALVSSANLNGRSLRWDTEAGVVIEDEGFCAALRRKLSAPLLPPDAEGLGLDAAAGRWRRLAEADRALPPRERRSRILPYALGPARRFGRPTPWLPVEIV